MEKYKQSETRIIKRSQINFAPYNPRKESKTVVEELRKNFKKVGFLGGIVWNELTGNLVGGHKRVMALDILNKYSEETKIENDYDIKVEVVSLELKTEQEQNIFLNNKRVQGEMDYELLASILPEIDIENTGLDDYDISLIESIVPNFSMGQNNEIIEDNKDLRVDYSQNKERIKELKKNIKKGISENQQATHFIVTFKTYDEKASFLESIGINGDDVFIVGEKFKERIFAE